MRSERIRDSQKRKEEKNKKVVVTEHQIKQEFELWQSHCPLLYDLIVEKKIRDKGYLSSLQFLPSISDPSDTKNTDRNGKQHAQRLLLTDTKSDRSEILTYSVVGTNKLDEAERFAVELEQQILCCGEVLQVRPMPQQPCIIAAQCAQHERGTRLFRLSTKSSGSGGKVKRSRSRPGDTENELLKALVDNENAGGGVCWNGEREGELLTCGDTGNVCLWEVDTQGEASGTLKMKFYGGHAADAVTDVDWQPRSDAVFLSCGLDGNFCLWDKRGENSLKPRQSQKASKKRLTRARFNKSNANLLATSGEDGVVRVWDTRNVRSATHELAWHSDAVEDISWNPRGDRYLCSAGRDRRVAVWDLQKAGKDQSEQDEAEGPAELLFVHGGHQKVVTGVDWSSALPNSMFTASIARDGMLQIWKMSQFLYDSSAGKAIKKQFKRLNEKRVAGKNKRQKRTATK